LFLSAEFSTSIKDNDPYLGILSLAAMFDGEVNFDWLLELEAGKASQIFSALEFGIKKKWLRSADNAFFHFVDSVQKQSLQDRLSHEEKKRLHRQIANLLLRELPSQPQSLGSIIPHLLFIPNDLEGCRLLIEGGKLAEKEFKYDEANKYYEKAVTDLRKLHGKDVDTLFIHAVLLYSRFCGNEIGTDNTISVLMEAVDKAQSNNIQDYMSLLELQVAKNEWIRSRFHIAKLHFEKGLTSAQLTNDNKLQQSIATFYIFFHYWMGQYREAVNQYEMFAPDIENFPDNSLPLLASLTSGVCYSFCGQTSQGLGMLNAIRLHSRKIGNLYVSGHAGIAIGELLIDIQHYEDGSKCLKTALKETEKSHNLFAYLAGLVLLGYAHYKMNDLKKAFCYISEYVELSERVQIFMRNGCDILEIAWAIEEGAFPRHEGIDVGREIELAFQGGNVFMKGLAYRYQALLKRKQGAPTSEIINSLKNSIRYLTESGHQLQLANAQIELTREYLRLGRKKTASKLAQQTVKILSAFNDNPIPPDIRTLAGKSNHGEDLLTEILRLGQELVTIRESKDLFRQIISIVNRITGAERGAIFLIENGKLEAPVLRAAKNLTARDINTSPFQASMQVIKQTVKTGKGRIVHWGVQGDSISLESAAIRSCVCVPMRIRDKNIGVLYHDNRAFRIGSQESDLEILNYFAAQAAIAVDNAEAWRALNELYDKKQREKEYYEREYLDNIHFENFVGKSSGIRHIFAQIEQVADTDATVLILGETGVGKELVARSIHDRSPRHDKPFIAVHCSSFPSGLISSELFGHERGAFTGAVTKQLGRFELANHGTLFLDEIGDISLDVQVKLLRVLQSGEFERVGGHETHRSDFRLITATNRDLRKEIQDGRFREDLYYRLNVFPIHVIPLRERREDIPLLVQYFLQKFAQKFRSSHEKIPPEEMGKLMNYNWPGNVRELQNVIERAVILSKGADFRIPSLANTETESSHDTDALTLETIERNHILRILEKTHGKVSGPAGAAEILAVAPSTLNSRMKKLGIKRVSLPRASFK